MYLLLGRYPEAIEALKHSIDLRPRYEAYGNLGYAYFLLHQFPEAVAALEEGIKLDGRAWPLWGNLGDTLYWSADRRPQAPSKYRQAISLANASLVIDPNDAETLAYLADYSAMIDDQPGALDYLKRALKLAPSDGEVLFRAAIVYNHFQRIDEALTSLRKAADVGYSKTVMRDTPDFSGVRDNPQFKALIGPG
jgi:tetratricopeptide (TPR) repeat protein